MSEDQVQQVETAAAAIPDPGPEALAVIRRIFAAALAQEQRAA